jgi:hypothetical protein
MKNVGAEMRTKTDWMVMVVIDEEGGWRVICVGCAPFLSFLLEYCRTQYYLLSNVDLQKPVINVYVRTSFYD